MARKKVPKFGVLDFEYDPNDEDWTPLEEVLENLQMQIKAGKLDILAFLTKLLGVL